VTVPRTYSRRRLWWLLVALLPLAVFLHGGMPAYELARLPVQVESNVEPATSEWAGVARIGRLIARVPHARIVFPTALILSVWLLTIVIVYGRDIYFANRAKRAESHLYSELVNSTRVGYCSVTEDGRIESCNAALADMLGVGETDAAGMSLVEIGLPPDRLLAGELTALRLQPVDGPQLPVLAAAMAGDEEIGHQIIVAPIPAAGSESGATASPRSTSRQQDSLKREFLRSLNHELRTPLTVILGSATILESDVSEGNADLVDAIRDGGERLLHVLEAMMLLSELEASEPEDMSGSVEIGAVLNEAAAEYAGVAKQKGLDFTVSVPDELIFAAADPRGVRQIVGQLVDNAIKFTEVGSIDLSASSEGPQVRMTVSDSGRGIDPALLPLATSDFREGPESGRGAAGIGLGLARLIAERMQGRLALTSSPGVGTRVEVYLRNASADGDQESANPLAA
jgi:PAS domain S-box-containing protein